MRKIILMVCLVVLPTCVLFAQDQEVMDNVLDKIERADEMNHLEALSKKEPEIKYTFEIGPEFHFFRYKEPTIDVKDEAFMYGIQAAISGRSQSKALMGRVEGRFVRGRVDYDGSLNDGTPWTDKGDDFAFEFRALAGRDFMWKESRITPIFGVGFRYLNDDLESQYAYEREIRYTYSPIGFETLSPFGPGWSWGLKAEYDIFWQGIVRSHLSDVNSSYNNLRNKQDSGFGVRGSIYLNRKIGDKLSFSIEPFIRYWDIDQSDNANVTYAGHIVGYGYEPRNRTEEYGLKMSLVW